MRVTTASAYQSAYNGNNVASSMYPADSQQNRFRVPESEIIESLGKVTTIARVIKKSLGHAFSLECSLEDLEGIGVLGLLDAAQRYDPSRGVKFFTFAERRVRGAILEYIRDNTPLTRHARQIVVRVEDSYAKMRSRLSRDPTLEEIAANIGVNPEELAKKLDKINSYLIKVGKAQNNGNYSNSNNSSGTYNNILEKLMREDTAKIVWSALLKLKRRGRRAIMMYYVGEMTNSEIGMVFGINESGASMLRSRAISKLREELSPKRDWLTW